MNNPFITVFDDRSALIIDQWLSAKLIENEASGRDLISYESEWRMYTLGQVKQLAQVAGFDLHVSHIDLNSILNSQRMKDEYENEWINKVKIIDELYMDIILDYIEDIKANPENHIKIA